MKTEIEIDNGLITITTVDNRYSITLDVKTAVVMELDFIDSTLSELNSFLKKAKTRYNKFMNSKAVEDFTD